MLRLAKLVGLLNVGGAIADSIMIKKLMHGFAVFCVLAILCAVMASALIVGMLYLLYYGLTVYGLSTPEAMLATAAVIVFFIAITLWATIRYFRNMFRSSNIMLKVQAPVATAASSIAGAFMDGLLTREVHMPSPDQRLTR